MFFGTIDDNVRRYIAAQADAFAGAEVVIGCSGNFASEKVLSSATQPAALHANDILALQLAAGGCHAGAAQSGHRAGGGVRLADALPRCRRSVAASQALLMLLLRMLRHEKQRTAFDRRMYAHYCEALPRLVAETAERLAPRAVPLASYFNGDVWEHYQRFGDHAEAIFTGYFPFFKGDYERQYKRAGQILQWPVPTYPLLDSERKAGLIAWLREPGRRYLFLLPEPLEGLEPQMISHKQRNTWVYLYANLSVRTGLFRRRYHDSGRRFIATPGFPGSPPRASQ